MFTAELLFAFVCSCSGLRWHCRGMFYSKENYMSVYNDSHNFKQNKQTALASPQSVPLRCGACCPRVVFWSVRQAGRETTVTGAIGWWMVPRLILRHPSPNAIRIPRSHFSPLPFSNAWFSHMSSCFFFFLKLYCRPFMHDHAVTAPPSLAANTNTNPLDMNTYIIFCREMLAPLSQLL